MDIGYPTMRGNLNQFDTILGTEVQGNEYIGGGAQFSVGHPYQTNWSLEKRAGLSAQPHKKKSKCSPRCHGMGTARGIRIPSISY